MVGSRRWIGRRRYSRWQTGRRVAIGGALAAIAAAVLSAGALAAPPNLTGTWNDPGGHPTYHLQAGSGLSTLSATWSGAPGSGHEGLRGSFNGTLDSGGNSYSGTLHITEGGVATGGSMTFTIVSASELRVTYRQDNGLAGTPFTLRRQPRRALHFSFRGYANDVKVVPPLVGDFQLGIARIQGFGDLGDTPHGTIVGSNRPQSPRFQPTNMQASVDGYTYRRSAHGVDQVIDMTIHIVSTDAPRCEAGDTGTLSLRQSHQRLRNHQRAHWIIMHWDGGRCPEFVQGWTNDNGGARTSPHFGGPPHGGQWAIVDIR